MIRTQLVDRRNIEELRQQIIDTIRSTQFSGLDCETEDSRRHEGLNLLMKVDDEGHKAGNTKLVFDTRRTTMCGLSIFPEGHDVAWYFNLAHSDVENRLTWAEVKPFLDARPANGFWLCHNAPFELVMFRNCHGYELTNVICTMQLSVTAFGDDVYDIEEFKRSGLGGMERLLRPLMIAALKGGPQADGPSEDEDEDDGSRRKFNREVDELIGKITSKTSDAEHSYNGYVYNLAYGHGLKQLVLRLFGHKMSTFDETLGEEAHMGMVSGDQVAEYGAEDAYWVVPLFRHLMIHIAANSPDALETFFTQENPMIDVYADLWRGGMRVYRENILARRDIERQTYANLLRTLRAALRGVGDFADEPHPDLAKRQTWYLNPEKGSEGYKKYRKKITDWLALDDHEDDYEECFRVSAAVPNAWATELRDPRKRITANMLSIQHYMPARVLLYDLLRGKMQFDMGKVASDGEARGKIKAWFQAQEQDERVRSCIQAIDCLNEMAGVDQRMKLYLTPYLFLTDPETERLYPTVNCLLNTRRLAASTPNPMQLAKRGESTYVRGFFKGENDDHLLVSIDWSAIELVIVGELSKDPEFRKVYGQRPHEDLHIGAAASILSVEMPWITEDHLRSCRQFAKIDDFLDNYGLQPENAKRLFTNLKGEAITEPGKARGYWRTEIGKGSNFNYWFSGWLATTGTKMGWGMNQTAAATEAYRNRFAVAEQWRVETIDHGRTYGWVQLPDGHRRHRYEATWEWLDVFKSKWPRDPMLDLIVHEIAKRIHKRAHNQLVNALVQGTCATLMKRTTLRVRAKLLELGWTQQELARFLIPIHDEKVYSVHWCLVVDFVRVVRGIMLDHDDLFPTLKLDASPAVGVTFEPWHEKKAPLGQVELFEPPEEIVGKERAGKPLNDDGVWEVVNHLRGTTMRMAA